MDVSCPSCRNVDSVQKVSSIVSSGTTHGSYGGAWSGDAYFSGSSATNLATLLMPPDAPKESRFTGYFLWYVFGTWALGGVCVLLSMLGALVFAPFTGGLDEPIGAVIIQMFGYTIIASIFMVPLVWMIRDRKRWRDAYPAKEAVWISAMENWDQLYYCFRDDLVFDPESGKTVKPQFLNEFLSS
ncbi:MAG: hypothetical protein M9928_05835 [Anaerolineae bacterium]|nr:hypothetical protein [Anaerolineae bacterium]MCO5197103.1 hypothetical protein [Anaerolineae bacterium]MCO5204530.1 hypothetical protein [Anaerolineae bacterium]